MRTRREALTPALSRGEREEFTPSPRAAWGKAGVAGK